MSMSRWLAVLAVLAIGGALLFRWNRQKQRAEQVETCWRFYGSVDLLGDDFERCLVFRYGWKSDDALLEEISFEGATPPYPAIFALAYGAGLEVSAILSVVESDVEMSTRQVRARGTKAWTRDRLTRVADWAWPYLEAHLQTVLPGERVFRAVDRWAAGDYHKERLRALGVVGYRLHDARHHWAVRMARAGAPFELIARQLGHKDVTMVAKVYGRFKPDTEERDRWERIAAARDAEKWPFGGAKGGAVAKTQLEVESVTDWEESSRGGTRTRDPGIMSAVL
jgi:hypothetical protein